MKVITTSILILIGLITTAQLRYNVEGGGSNLVGFGFNLEYKHCSSRDSNLIFIPKLGLGHTFIDKALTLQVGFALGTVI